MKEKQLREHTTCSICKEKIGASGMPAFWTFKIEHHGLKVDAIQRQDGLTAMLGGHAMLAQVMGVDAEMTSPIGDPVVLTVCETCVINGTATLDDLTALVFGAL